MLWSPRHTSVGLRAKFVGRKGNWLVAAQGRLLAVRSFQSSCSVTESPACTAMASQRQLLADQSCPEAESDSGQLQIQRPLYGATTPSARPAQFGHDKSVAKVSFEAEQLFLVSRLRAHTIRKEFEEPR